MRHGGKLFIMAGMAVCFLFSGCSAGKGGGEKEQSSDTYKPSTEPVTIRIATTPSASVTEDDFKLLFAGPVQAKYPHITVELVKYGNGSTVEDWIASGRVPDMMLVWNGELKGKRIDSIFKSKPAPGKEFSPYFAEARTILLQGFNEFADGKDANTVLREAEEKANAMLSQK